MEYKIVLIGEAQVGKSTFIKKLVTKNFDELYTPTLGVNVFPVHIETNFGPFYFKVWDCAGNPNFIGLADGYYLGMNGAIIMVDDRIQTIDNINNEKQKILNINNQVPISILINKCDLLNENKFNFATYEEFTNINDNVITISTKNDTLDDLNEVFLLLAKKITNNDNLTLNYN